MTAYEVFLNGERLCVAGITGRCVLSAMVNCVQGATNENMDLAVGGLDSATEEHLIWTHTDLKVGDEVRVKLLDAESVDEPGKRYFTDSQQDLENRKAYVRAMAQSLGWTVAEGSEGSAIPPE